MIKLILVVLAFFGNGLGEVDYVINNKKFPADFLFGTATASYQVEGAWDIDGKSQNIWDNFTHSNPHLIVDGTNGDVACDSYNKYKEDVAMLKYLGLNHYRFSLSWSRILPNGLPDQINGKGIQYYKNLLQELKNKNIIPLVTLYHWDLPQALQDRGGFHSDEFPRWFADYSRIVFRHLGDTVKYWITFNEPTVLCRGYGVWGFAPGVNMPGVGEYLCIHNLLKAHAAAYHLYKREFSTQQNGKLAISHSINYYEPLTNNSADVTASEQKMQFDLGWVADPLYYGDYPKIMKIRIANRSRAEGFNQSRLPEFTEEEKRFLRNTSDYFGVNVYSSLYAFAIAEPVILLPPSLESDSGVGSQWTDGDGTFGMTDLLRWISNRYNHPDIIITENGLGTPTSSTSLEDDDRINKIKNSLSRFRDAIDDNINLFGYTAWSLMDNYEWNQGYTQKYGIYEVDFNSPNRTRTPRKSATWYKQVIATRCIVDNCIN